MRIGLDVDGVVYDWDSSVRRILKMTYDLDIGVSRSWDHIDSRCTPEQWSSLWSGYPLMDMFTRGFYYPGAITAVETLALDHEVFFITAAPPAVRKARGISLFSDFRGINGVIFVDPGSDDKTLLKCDLYVDDKQVFRVRKLKRYGDYGEPPGVSIHIVARPEPVTHADLKQWKGEPQ